MMPPPYSGPMAAADGTYTLGPQSGQLLIKTARTGLGSKAGHDLTIEVTSWEGTATVDTAQPSNSSVSVDARVDSFEVREGTGGVKPLTDTDRGEIEQTLREKILHSGQHPSITFRATSVEGSQDSFTVEGELTIVGRTQPTAVHGAITDSRARGSATVTQSRWGIKPYQAFLGALKLKDDVTVEFDAALS